MSDEKRQILEMLAEKKISVDEAERLLNALGESDDRQRHHRAAGEVDRPSADRKKPKYLFISVKPKEGEGKQGEKVNIKVPLFLLRTGLKIGGVLPDSAKEKINRALGEKGIDIGKLNEADFDELVSGLSDLAILVDDDNEKVSIYCE